MSKSNGELTAKQKAFVEEYVRNGFNATEAYLATHNTTNRKTANSAGPIEIKKPQCAAYLKELQAENVKRFGDIAEQIIKELAEDAFKMDESGNHSASWQKSVDLLQKQLGLQSSKVDVNAKADININILEDE